MQGRSLLPLMAGEETPADWRRCVYYAYYEDSWRWRDQPAAQMAEPGFSISRRSVSAHTAACARAATS